MKTKINYNKLPSFDSIQASLHKPKKEKVIKQRSIKYRLMIVDKEKNKREKFAYNKHNLITNISVNIVMCNSSISVLAGIDNHNIILETEKSKWIFSFSCSEKELEGVLLPFENIHHIGVNCTV
jgi:hypothetical protein